MAGGLQISGLSTRQVAESCSIPSRLTSCLVDCKTTNNYIYETIKKVLDRWTVQIQMSNMRTEEHWGVSCADVSK